ncbi:MAG: hypothetical protein IRZ03_11635 [Acidobacterium ailaaui]|jgi:DNA-binding NarL/FixJ family response regulator|nr:hypothetical protein [Pseudacidobacterium ailaaui]MCL6463962.1 hypothetical protein [Pseudacidobacterium ailaaui]MDI3253703.1 hypothetical protein [Bacillota bacterium]
MSARILLVGNDPQLLVTRAAVVHTRWQSKAADPEDTLKALREDTFHIVVLCHTIEQPQAAILAEKIHRLFPTVRLLALETTLGSADYIRELGQKYNIATGVASVYAPEEMLEAIAYLLQD